MKACIKSDGENTIIVLPDLSVIVVSDIKADAVGMYVVANIADATRAIKRKIQKNLRYIFVFHFFFSSIRCY
jgi:hypothetical protein